jgi:hypothetical protein
MSKRIATGLLALLAPLVAAGGAPEPGLLLREGNWAGDAGSYLVPHSLALLPTARWPVDGWHRLRIEARSVVVSAVAAGSAQSGPSFLSAIAAQVAAARDGGTILETSNSPSNDLYLRIEGIALAEHAAPAYVFRNGTTSIRPELDRRYELLLGDKPFAFTVHNGARTPSGAPYGGAHYVIEVDGETREYLIGEFGWDSTIEAIADLDGDGEPDFIVRVAGNNSDVEAVLLSSRAKPGRNPATASLVAIGC